MENQGFEPFFGEQRVRKSSSYQRVLGICAFRIITTQINVANFISHFCERNEPLCLMMTSATQKCLHKYLNVLLKPEMFKKFLNSEVEQLSGLFEALGSTHTTRK